MLSIEWNLIRLDGPARGIPITTPHKSLPEMVGLRDRIGSVGVVGVHGVGIFRGQKGRGLASCGGGGGLTISTNFRFNELLSISIVLNNFNVPNC